MSSAARCIALAFAASLAACGGERADAPPERVLAAATALAPGDGMAVAQRLYLAYLGRPGDPAGLAFHAEASQYAGLPEDAAGIHARYAADPAARQLLDGMAASSEVQALASTDAAALTSAYRNLFNREPDSAGGAFWSGLLTSGALTRAELPLAIMAAARGEDGALLERKLRMASAFSAALDTPERVAAYQGDAAAAALRDSLREVGASGPDEGALVASALSKIAAVPVFSQVEAIVRTRCVACHSVTPTMRGFSTAPRGIRFDTPAQIRADARRIYVNVVQTEFMPYGNVTAMTAAERALVRKWYEEGGAH
jgi:hypothetical protein